MILADSWLFLYICSSYHLLINSQIYKTVWFITSPTQSVRSGKNQQTLFRWLHRTFRNISTCFHTPEVTLWMSFFHKSPLWIPNGSPNVSLRWFRTLTRDRSSTMEIKTLVEILAVGQYDKRVITCLNPINKTNTKKRPPKTLNLDKM